MSSVKKEKDTVVNMIREWFEENGPESKAVIGLSGGKDSTIVAALCVEALGADRVVGVMMPSHNQGLNDADKIAEKLGIKTICVSISSAIDAIKNSVLFNDKDFVISEKATLNLPPRLRMSILYFVSQCIGGRVVGTTNASEQFIGYFTRWGDQCSDFEPIIHLTVTQLKEIGYLLPVPKECIDKTPDDGLPGSCPDEEKFGFTYKQLDEFIENGTTGNMEIDAKVTKMRDDTYFKRKMIPDNFDNFWDIFDVLGEQFNIIDE